MIGPHNTCLVPRDNLTGSEHSPLPWHHAYAQALATIARNNISMARHVANTLSLISWSRSIDALTTLHIALATDARAHITTLTTLGTRRRVFDFTDGSALSINLTTGRVHILEIAEPTTITNMGELA